MKNLNSIKKTIVVKDPKVSIKDTLIKLAEFFNVLVIQFAEKYIYES